MNISEFLEARIAEDEAALNAVPSSAKQLDDFDFGGTDDYLRVTMGYGRAVAECAAKREIIRWWVDGLIGYVRVDDELTNPLLPLAAVYKDHKDYQQEWAP